MATRRIMVGDQEVQIPDFNFKITPVLVGLIVLWLVTGVYIVIKESRPPTRSIGNKA